MNQQIKHPDYFSEEEKKILINYFVLEGKSCKKDFHDYLSELIKTYGVENDNIPIKAPINPNNSVVLSNINHWDLDLSYVLWGNEKNDNLATFLFSEDKFDFSKTKIKNLNKLNINWNHINNDGENALHIMAKKNSISGIEDLINNQKVDGDVKNNHGNYFSWYLVHPEFVFPKSKNIEHFFISEIYKLQNSFSFFQENLHHMKNLETTKIVEMEENIKNLSLIYKNHMELLIKEELSKNVNRFNLKVVKEEVNNLFLGLEKLVNYYKLEKTLPNISLKVKNSKI